MQYSTLSSRSIRILHLKDTTLLGSPSLRFQDVTISCRLEEISLDAVESGQVAYTALSYCWGANAFGRDIVCDGKTVRVTGNLYNALMQLTRDLHESTGSGRGKTILPLWVDALCINQVDLVEKSHQVAMMGEIYQTAASVLVWLGTGSEIAGGATGSFWEKICSGEVSTLHSWESKAGDELLASSPWFKRVWTLQEIVLARSAMVQCGPLAVSADILFEQCGNVEPVRLIKDLRSKALGNQSLTGLLVASGKRVATEARDKIFSVQGMLPRGYLSDPDYYKDTHLISLEAATVIIREVRNLRILDLVSRPQLILAFSVESPPPHERKASWVPNLATAANTRITQRFLHEESLGFHPSFCFDARVEDSLLTCRGAMVGCWSYSGGGRSWSGCPIRLPACLRPLLVGPNIAHGSHGCACAIPDNPTIYESIDIYWKFQQHSEAECGCEDTSPGTSISEGQVLDETQFPDTRPMGGWLCYLFGASRIFTLRPELDVDGKSVMFRMTGMGQTDAAYMGIGPGLGTKPAPYYVETFEDWKRPCGCSGFWIPMTFKIR